MPRLYAALSTWEQRRRGFQTVPGTRQDVAFVPERHDKMSRAALIPVAKRIMHAQRPKNRWLVEELLR